MGRQTANELQEGNHILVEGEPYVVKKESTSMPGKHGHAKKKLELQHVFTGRNRSESYGAHDEVDIPQVERNDAQVVSVEDDEVQLMDMDTYDTFDVKAGDFDLENGDEVIYVAAEGRKKIEEKKEE